ncbi:MAG: RNA methyltransferase [Candidatus Falkowbacteria bacterium]|nr:RNA methyltransferase [Candidatus Falkowbacteria bacterium]
MENITSISNPKIKLLMTLRTKSAKRKEAGLFLIDGLREVKEAIRNGLIIEQLFYCEQLVDNFKEIQNLGQELTKLSKEAFLKVCYKESPDGVIALAKAVSKSLKDLKVTKNSIFLVLEAVEKPGNLGAILRTARAGGVSGIILNNQQTDIFNPNVIRASQGFVFAIPVVEANTKETIDFFAKNKVKSFATSLRAKKSYIKADYSGPSAFVFGTEADGLSDYWQNSASELIKIPMMREMDSLNVSVSAALVVFEALRQRGKL